MIIPELFREADVLALESQILQEYGFPAIQAHFHEDVAQILWHTWNRNPTLENRDRFLLYLFPLIKKLMGPFIRFIEDDSFGLQYSDLWQEAIIKSIDIMPKYNPNRINKQGKKAKIFCYWTYILQYHLQHLTSNEHKKWKNREASLGEVCKSSDANQHLQDFQLFVEKFAQRRNLRQKHREIFIHLAHLPTGNLAGYANQLPQTLAQVCGTTTKDVEAALRLVRKAYGQVKVSNVSVYIPPTVKE